jgi:type I protein arginine methyltransferase
MAVLDAGTGSGILACLAARAGARVVYAVDQADILEAARGVVERSGLAAQVRLLRGDFRDIRLPEPVDLVITETFGAWALAEAGLEDLVTTCQNNLAPGGKVLPGAVELWLGPVGDLAPLEEALGPFSRYEGVHLDALIPTALRRGITTTLLPEHLAGPGRRLCSVPLPSRLPCGGRVRFEAERITGLGCWFQLDLGEGYSLSTHPSAPLTHWRHHFLPLPLECGGELALEVEIEPAKEDRRGLEISLSWQTATQQGQAWYRLR